MTTFEQAGFSISQYILVDGEVSFFMIYVVHLSKVRIQTLTLNKGFLAQIPGSSVRDPVDVDLAKCGRKLMCQKNLC